jgi:hypothetical protein
VAGPLGEPVGADPAERLVSSVQLLARVHAPALTTQPFAVNKPRTREMNDETVNRPTEKCWPSRVVTNPTAPLMSAGFMTSPSCELATAWPAAAAAPDFS